MDADRVLAQMRATVGAMRSDACTKDHRALLAEDLVTQFLALDGHLSAGGVPPEVWREGPDAPDDEPDREPTPAQEEGWDAREDFLRGGHA